MTSTVEPVAERHDVRTVVGGGAKLGVLTAMAVVAFALLSRVMHGTIETIVQSLMVLAGGLLASFLPAVWVRPRSTDTIAWAALVGLLGALVFTAIDTVLLRPLGTYHWSWDEVGGGSGFWYIPVWWMGSALLAWLGAWIVATVAGARERVSLVAIVGQTAVLTAAVFTVFVLSNAAPARPAIVALALCAALVLSVPLSTVLARR